MSTENAIIIENVPRWPLIIDPQAQAKRWLSCKEGVGLYKVRISKPNYMKTVKRAIRMGDAMLIHVRLQRTHTRTYAHTHTHTHTHGLTQPSFSIITFHTHSHLVNT